jgi:hypothetical protein
MANRPTRETVDLSGYPNLVVIHLGMRVNALAGIRTLLGFGPKIAASVEAKPDGLLLHENFLFSLRHAGMRQYWGISMHSRNGRGRIRTAFGGSSS